MTDPDAAAPSRARTSEPKRRHRYRYRRARRIASTSLLAVPASDDEIARRAGDVVSILLGARATDRKPP